MRRRLTMSSRYGGRGYGRYGGREDDRADERGYEREAEGRDGARRVERPSRHDDVDEVRDYDTDYGRTTSRFYGRSGYEYGRDDYDERAEHERREARGGDGGSWLDRAADQVRSWFGGDEDERERGPRGDETRRAYGRGEGKFRGRGPKNYHRSDERLRD